MARCRGRPVTARRPPSCLEAFAKSSIATTPLPRPPSGAVRVAQADLPVKPAAFLDQCQRIAFCLQPRKQAPQIVYPPEGAHVDLGAGSGDLSPLMLKLHGGLGAVPLACKRQAAARSFSPAHQPMDAGWWRLLETDGDRRDGPCRKRRCLHRLNLGIGGNKGPVVTVPGRLLRNGRRT